MSAPVRPGEQAAALGLRALRRPWLWLGLWLAAIAATVILSLTPPPAVAVPHGFDKLEHATGYALLAFGAVGLFARMRAQCRAAAGLVALGVVMEVAQGALTQHRLAEPADALANTLGVFLGLAIAATPAATWLQRLDRRLP